MPVNEYYCDNCRRDVSITLSISGHDKAKAPYVFLANVTQVLIDAPGGGGLGVLASGILADEVSVFDNVSGKHIAIAPAVHRAK